MSTTSYNRKVCTRHVTELYKTSAKVPDLSLTPYVLHTHARKGSIRAVLAKF